MIKLNEKQIDMNVKFAPYRTFAKSPLVKDLLNCKNDSECLNTIVQENLDKSINYPILLTFLKNLHPHYDQMVHFLTFDVIKEIQTIKTFNINDVFSSYYFSSCSLLAILDNVYVDYKFKRKLLVSLFSEFLKFTNAGFFYTAFLDFLYAKRKTSSVPILAVKLLFSYVNFNISSKKSVNYFMLSDSFIQHLTDQELAQSMPILLKKPGLHKWINMVHVDSYKWLLSKLAFFLPYDFTKKRLLPACMNKFNVGLIDVLLQMKHLKEEDVQWLHAFSLLKKLA